MLKKLVYTAFLIAVLAGVAAGAAANPSQRALVTHSFTDTIQERDQIAENHTVGSDNLTQIYEQTDQYNLEYNYSDVDGDYFLTNTSLSKEKVSAADNDLSWVFEDWNRTGQSTYIFDKAVNATVTEMYPDGSPETVNLSVELSPNNLTEMLLDAYNPLYSDEELITDFNEQYFWKDGDLNQSGLDTLKDEAKNLPVVKDGAQVGSVNLSDGTLTVSLTFDLPNQPQVSIPAKIGSHSASFTVETQTDWNEGTFNGTTAENPENTGNLMLGLHNGTGSDNMQLFGRFDGTSWNDYSGNGEAATESGTINKDQAGVFGTDAWRFNGGEELDFGDNGLTDGWSQVTTQMAFTVETQGRGRVAGKRGSDNDNYYFRAPSNSTHVTHLEQYTDSSGGSSCSYSIEDQNVKLGEMMVVTSVWNGDDNGRTDIWLNGTRVSSDASCASGGSLAANSNSFKIGEAGKDQNNLDGRLDGFQLYDTKLSNSTIKQYHQWLASGRARGTYNSSTFSIPSNETVTDIEVDAAQLSSAAEAWATVHTTNGESDTVKLDTTGTKNYTLDFSKSGGTAWVDYNFTSTDLTQTAEISDFTLYTASEEDTTPPNISLHDPANATISDTTPLLNYSADEILDYCKYNVDSDTNTSLSACANTNLSALSDGGHDVTVWANDTAGNWGSSQRFFTVETPPNITNLSATPDPVDTGQTVNITTDVTDANNNVDRVRCTLKDSSGNIELDNVSMSVTGSDFTLLEGFEDGTTDGWTGDTTWFDTETSPTLHGTYTANLNASEATPSVTSPSLAFDKHPIQFTVRIGQDTGDTSHSVRIKPRNGSGTQIGQLLFQDGSNDVQWYDGSFVDVATNYWSPDTNIEVVLDVNYTDDTVEIFLDGTSFGTFALQNDVAETDKIVFLNNNLFSSTNRQAYLDDIGYKSNTDYTYYCEYTPVEEPSNIGNWTAEVYANDTEGASSSDTTTFTVQDADAPDIEYTAAATASGTYSQGWVLVNVSASDGDQLDAVRDLFDNVNSTFTNSSSGYWWENHTGLSDGDYTVQAWANDTAGNYNFTAERTITLDTIQPEITVHNPANTTMSVAAPALNVTASESIATWKYQVDGGSNTTFTPNTTLASLSDGQHTVTVYAEDAAGNWNRITRTFTVDATPPQILFTGSSTAEGEHNQSWLFVNVSAQDGTTAVTTVTEEFDGTNSSFNTSKGTYSWENHTGLSDGTYLVQAFATDSVGNTNATVERSITLDTVASSSGGGGGGSGSEPSVGPTIQFETAPQYPTPYTQQELHEFTVMNNASQENTVELGRPDTGICQYIAVQQSRTSSLFGRTATYDVPANRSIPVQFRVSMPSKDTFAALATNGTAQCQLQTAATQGTAVAVTLTVAPDAGLIQRLNQWFMQRGLPVPLAPYTQCVDPRHNLQDLSGPCPAEHRVTLPWAPTFPVGWAVLLLMIFPLWIVLYVGRRRPD